MNKAYINTNINAKKEVGSGNERGIDEFDCKSGARKRTKTNLVSRKIIPKIYNVFSKKVLPLKVNL